MSMQHKGAIVRHMKSMLPEGNSRMTFPFKSAIPAQPKQILAVLTLLASTALTTPSVFAQTTDLQTTVEYEGSRIRVNLSGRLRHITQEVAASSCSLVAGFDREVSMGRLVSSRTEFNNLFTSLAHGNTRLGIPSREDASRVKTGLTALLKVWASTSVTTLKMLTADELDAYGVTIAANTLEQSDVTQALSEEFIAEYVNPSELFAADALTVSIAGRQLQLIRQMERQSCGVLSGNARFGNRADLEASADVFQKSLNAMRDGLTEAGVIAPPNDSIRDQIGKVADLWDVQRAALLSDLATTDDAEENWTNLTSNYDELFDASERLVSLYLLAAPGNTDAFKLAVSSYAEAELISWTQAREMTNAIAGVELERADGLLNIRMSQSNNVVLAAQAFDNTSQVIAKTDTPMEVGSELAETMDAILNGASDIVVGDAIWDKGRDTYFSQVFVPITNEGAAAGVLVVEVNLIPFL